DAFPPSWGDPGTLASWLVRVHTGPLFAYPQGGSRLPALTVFMFACFVVGAVARSRREPRTVVVLVLPFLLTLGAAVLRRCPYGMSVRVAQFLMPATLLLAAEGASSLCTRARRFWVARWITPGLVAILASMGLWRLAGDLGHPYRTPWDRTNREFARWFWDEL